MLDPVEVLKDVTKKLHEVHASVHALSKEQKADLTSHSSLCCAAVSSALWNVVAALEAARKEAKEEKEMNEHLERMHADEEATALLGDPPF